MSRARAASSEQLRADLARAGAAPRAKHPAEIGAFLARYMLRSPGPVLPAVARAVYGVPLEADERAALARVCPELEPDPAGYVESIWIVGRRGGKSSGAAAIGVYEAVVRGPGHLAHLEAGQRAHIPVVSRTLSQARTTFSYAANLVTSRPELEGELAEQPLESSAGGSLRFRNGITLSVLPASKSSLRGYTAVAAIVDEAAHLGGADEESERDVDEIVSTLRYSLLAPAGAPRRRLLAITSPGIRAGYVYEAFSRWHGKRTPPILIAHGASWVWNPTLSRDALEAERARDPRRFAREAEALFVDAIDFWCAGDLIDGCARGRTAEPLPRADGVRHVAGLDLGLRRDATGFAIAHRENQRVVVDGAWRWAPKTGQPLHVAVLADQVAEIARTYGLRSIVADQYSFAALREVFRARRIELIERTATEASKLEKFGRLRELILGDALSLPDHVDLLTELRGLEERETTGGHVSIAGRRDDLAHALAWAVGEISLTPPATYRRPRCPAKRRI